MAIEKSKRKSGTVYRAYWRNPFTGKVERGPWSSKANAERQDDEVKFRLKYERESFKPAEPEKPISDLTVADVLYVYFTKAEMTESTRKNSLYHIKPITASIGKVPVMGLTRKHLKGFEAAQCEAGLKQNTIQRRISLLRAALNYAEDQEIIPENPVPRYRCKYGQDAKIKPPTPHEAALLYRHAPEHIKRVILIGYQLGVRIGRSELFKMQWKDVDIENRRVCVEASLKRKEEPWRYVNINSALLPLLKTWKKKDELLEIPWVIHWNGQPIKFSIRTAWHTTLRKAGITRRIRPYDLRHAFATYALEAGADAKATAELMGHSSMAMIHRHYQHVLNRQKASAVELLPQIEIGDDELKNGIQIRDTKQPNSAHFLYPEEKKIQ